jgi:ribosomal-protein-serine acetyltransferase
MDLLDDRLRLRPWQQADAPALARAAAESMDTVGRWLPWCHPNYGLENANHWIDHCKAGWASKAHFAFAVFDRGGGELVGAAGLSQFNHPHRSANLGYWIRQSRQREGFATAAVRMVAAFGFDSLGLIRIELVVLPDNWASRRTAESAGAAYEGIARHRVWAADQARDAAVYGLIPGDLDSLSEEQNSATCR